MRTGGVCILLFWVAAIGYVVCGISPSTMLSLVNGLKGQGRVEQQLGVRGIPADPAAQFVDVIGTSTDEVWKTMIPGYIPPAAILLYDQATSTGCGLGQTAMGPIYCPQDQKVYLDLSFWNQLETTFGAKVEFARAYVVAHEVGHHVQTLTGQIDRGQGAPSVGTGGGSVRTELQADCYAGVWAAHASQVSRGRITINSADIEDGLGADAAVGDDTLQSKTQGQVQPDSFTHGTSAQRMRWFKVGYDGGNPKACAILSSGQL